MRESRSTTAIILGGGVREALMAQPVVRAVPGATVFAAPDAIGTLIRLPSVGRAFTLDATPERWLSAYRRLRTGTISRVVLTRPVSAGAAALAYFAGVPRRLMLEGPYDWIATRRVRGVAGLHLLDANHRLAGSLAGSEAWAPAGSLGPPALQPPPAVNQRLRERFFGFLDQPAGYLLILPGRGSWSRGRPGPLWAAERFAVVANLSAAGRVVIVGGRGDERLVREARAGIGKPTIAVSLAELTIEETAAIAETSLAVIGHDGDALHVAAACGANVLALMGEGDTPPRGPRVTTVPVVDFGRLPARNVAERLEQHLRVTSYA